MLALKRRIGEFVKIGKHCTVFVSAIEGETVCLTVTENMFVKPRGTVDLSEDAVLQVVDVSQNQVRLAIQAPRDVKILRGEVKDRDAEQE